MKTVLILTYYWPPGSGPGVQRWLKFTKYLPEFGWKPVVITVKNGSYPNIDESLKEDISSEVIEIRTKTFEPFALYNFIRGKKGKAIEVGMGSIKDKKGLFSRLANYVRSNFFIPDARVGWNRYAFPEAIKAIRKYHPDVILTTGPPHSSHLMGERLQKLFNIPWVADLRDPWTTIYYNEFLLRTSRSKKKDDRLENQVLRSANLVITTSPALKTELEERSNRIAMIPNGFDDEDFAKAQLLPEVHFTLSYVGNFKANQNINAFWMALSELAAANDFRDKFRLRLVGNVHPSVRSSIAHHGLDRSVVIEPFQAHQRAVEIMISSHALLLPVPHSPNNKGILTGKIFEYLASQRPILSIGPIDGNASEILKECGKEKMLDYQDTHGIKGAIQALFESYKASPEPLTSGNQKFLNYSRKGTTKKLAELLVSLSS